MDNLFKILNSITGFKDKVAYRMFPVGAAPALPFIVYYSQTAAKNVVVDRSPGGSVSVEGGGGGGPARVCTYTSPQPGASTHIGECCRYLEI